MRRKLVKSMKTGDNFVLNFDNLVPDFKKDFDDSNETNPVFPLQQICDFYSWREDDEYKNILREEDVNTELNGYHSIIFLATYTSDEEMVKVVKSIPESDMMQVILVEPEKVDDQNDHTQYEAENECSCNACIEQMEADYEAE